MKSADSGYTFDTLSQDGGFASIGVGASRALPAGGWVLPDAPYAPSVRVPGKVADTNPWKVADYVPPAIPVSDIDKMLDLFRSTFGNKVSSPVADTQGAVVVYGTDQAQSAGMSGAGKLLVVAVLAFASWWAWKKWGKRAAA